MPGRQFWLSLAIVAGLLAGGSSPEIAQRVPRFLFPALGAAGALLVLLVLVRVLRRSRAEGRVRLVPLAVNALAALVLVVFPFAHAARALTGSPPRILTSFGDWLGAEGYPRLSRHRGLDIQGRPGSDVLAAAPGRVKVARDHGDLCGLIVVIDHEPHGFRTVYCHFSELAVRAGDVVTRGQRIGAVGTSGQRAWPGFEHVHLELQRGRDRDAVEDPRPRLVGCFDPAGAYPDDRLVLAHPVRC
jgi:murein DD-endopeptidase MepM/ murein hydrolase activator NlpD